MKNKKIVVIGGGTGLSTLLRGLKLYTNKITAVVTVADDGGSSGRLRDDLGMLPPGDVRNCVSALAETDTVWQELMNFRFSEGTLSGHSLGNLTLAALNEMSQSFEEAVMKFNQLMGVSGIVYPVTNESVVLSAVLEDGTFVEGESNIGTYREGENKGIKEIYMTPEKPEPVSGVIKAIGEADVIVIGPGSLYTSIIPNLLVDGVCDAIHKSKAKKIYVTNIMTQPGETDGYSASKHLDEIEKYSYKGIADAVILNTSLLPEGLSEKYALQNAYPVNPDTENLYSRTVVLEDNFVLVKNEKIRHNFMKLARIIMYFAGR